VDATWKLVAMGLPAVLSKWHCFVLFQKGIILLRLFPLPLKMEVCLVELVVR
ncbi:uncharacterized protein METZ01_LOCUS73103, partial [marine metagenome]